MATRTATKKPARKAARKGPARKAGGRVLSAAHKKALAEGRSMSATVDRYLSALNAPKPRGRKVTVDAMRARLAAKKAEAKTAIGVTKVLALQEARDLEPRIAAAQNGGASVNLKALETAFIKVAKQFSEARGVGYGAWRDSGVPAPVLAKAGIARTRSA